MLLLKGRTPRAVIIKNCAHDYEATDSFHDRFVRSTQWQGRSRRRRPGHARRVGHQTHSKEDPPPLQRQDCAGFAGSTADAFTLFSRFESKLEQYHGNLGRAAVELAKDWRTDKVLRHLEAFLLIVTIRRQTFLLSGTGDVIDPDDAVAAIGSGGRLRSGQGPRPHGTHRPQRPSEIAEEAMKIADQICIYNNDQMTIEELEPTCGRRQRTS